MAGPIIVVPESLEVCKVVHIKIDASRNQDWASFHDSFASTFGFPDFYGRNMDAWIDCMTSLDQPDEGMTTVHVGMGEILVLELLNPTNLERRRRDMYDAIISCCAFVNHRRIDVGEAPIIAHSFRDGP